jgi:hypothetical protein
MLGEGGEFNLKNETGSESMLPFHHLISSSF